MDAFKDIAVVSIRDDTAAYLARLRDVLGDETATCLSLQRNPLCYGYTAASFALRFLCPVSCGCGSLDDGIIMDTNGYCPDGALDQIESWIEAMPCVDNSSALQNIGALRASNLDLGGSCAEISKAEPWCKKTSVAAFCPVSCGCSDNSHPFCPPSCQ